MAKFRRTRKLFKFFFDIPSWIGFSQMKSDTNLVKGLATTALKIPKRTEHIEHFDEVMQRLEIDEASLKQRYNLFKLCFCLFMFLSASLFSYTIYVLLMGYVLNGIVCLSLTVLGFVLAFRYHFWMFQIERRKLGCSFKEWLKHILKKS